MSIPHPPTTTSHRACPVQRTHRALAPDLARGAMLLFIALANAGNVAFASRPGFDMTPHGLQRLLNAGLAVFVDARAYPVFALMFGYGLVQLSRRLRRDADPQTERRVLVRRNVALVGFGLLHATLLYFGDFLGAYGIVGVIATVVLLRRSDRFHRAVVWIWGAQLVYVGVLAVLVLLGHGGHSVPVNTPDPSLAATSYRDSVGDRLAEWPVHTVTVLPFIVIVWLGIYAARRRLLEDPAHAPLLKRVAAGCLAVTFAGALPYAAVTAGWLHVDAATMAAVTMLSNVSGMYGGPGYAALIGLVAFRLGSRRPRVVEAVSSLGRRSLTGYLTQSVVWVVAFSPWALDLGGSSYLALGVALATWLGTVAWATRLEARGDRGPAERALRRIAYGRPVGRAAA